ncbi:hypothetical protein D6783_01115 [Candidatus Woesearchaeota archaeon]|nr:MAG: hypothetical protein D6783_01115 [Candidatus Woesearchaeota archaeon]
MPAFALLDPLREGITSSLKKGFVEERAWWFGEEASFLEKKLRNADGKQLDHRLVSAFLEQRAKAGLMKDVHRVLAGQRRGASEEGSLGGDSFLEKTRRRKKHLNKHLRLPSSNNSQGAYEQDVFLEKEQEHTMSEGRFVSGVNHGTGARSGHALARPPSPRAEGNLELLLREDTARAERFHERMLAEYDAQSSWGKAALWVKKKRLVHKERKLASKLNRLDLLFVDQLKRAQGWYESLSREEQEELGYHEDITSGLTHPADRFPHNFRTQELVGHLSSTLRDYLLTLDELHETLAKRGEIRVEDTRSYLRLRAFLSQEYFSRFRSVPVSLSLADVFSYTPSFMTLCDNEKLRSLLIGGRGLPSSWRERVARTYAKAAPVVSEILASARSSAASSGSYLVSSLKERLKKGGVAFQRWFSEAKQAWHEMNEMGEAEPASVSEEQAGEPEAVVGHAATREERVVQRTLPMAREEPLDGEQPVTCDAASTTERPSQEPRAQAYERLDRQQEAAALGTSTSNPMEKRALPSLRDCGASRLLGGLAGIAAIAALSLGGLWYCQSNARVEDASKGARAPSTHYATKDTDATDRFREEVRGMTIPGLRIDDVLKGASSKIALRNGVLEYTMPKWNPKTREGCLWYMAEDMLLWSGIDNPSAGDIARFLKEVVLPEVRDHLPYPDNPDVVYQNQVLRVSAERVASYLEQQDETPVLIGSSDEPLHRKNRGGARGVEGSYAAKNNRSEHGKTAEASDLETVLSSVSNSLYTGAVQDSAETYLQQALPVVLRVNANPRATLSKDEQNVLRGYTEVYSSLPSLSKERLGRVGINRFRNELWGGTLKEFLTSMYCSSPQSLKDIKKEAEALFGVSMSTSTISKYCRQELGVRSRREARAALREDGKHDNPDGQTADHNTNKSGASHLYAHNAV